MTMLPRLLAVASSLACPMLFLQGERDYGPDVMQLLYIANRYERKPDLQRWHLQLHLLLLPRLCRCLHACLQRHV